MAEGTPRGTRSCTVLVLSGMFHVRGKNVGRRCPNCGEHWTVEQVAGEPPRVWRGEAECPEALLDWVGNNAAIECCQWSAHG
jgi:hypothetical protein